jgi:hypothetical protein
VSEREKEWWKACLYVDIKWLCFLNFILLRFSILMLKSWMVSIELRRTLVFSSLKVLFDEFEWNMFQFIFIARISPSHLHPTKSLTLFVFSIWIRWRDFYISEARDFNIFFVDWMDVCDHFKKREKRRKEITILKCLRIFNTIPLSLFFSFVFTPK